MAKKKAKERAVIQPQSDDLELLLSCAERVSRVWRDGEAKAKDNLRQAMNEMDWTVADVKKRMGKQETKRLERP